MATMNQLRAKKMQAINRARALAEMPAFGTDPETMRNYDKAVSAARSADDEMTAFELDTNRAALGSVIFGAGYGAGTQATTPELRAFVTPGSPTTDLWVRPPREIVQATPNQIAQRAAGDFLTTDTGTIGSAYYFTTELYKHLVMGLLDASGVLEAQPTLIVTDHLRPIQVPTLTADAVAVAGAEGAAATDTNPTGAHVDLDAHRFDGKFHVSIEMLMSAEYNLEAMLAQFATRSIANRVAGMLALGNGTTEPLGLFTASAVTVGKTCASAVDVTIDDMIAMAKALPKGYRRAGRTVVSDVLHTALVQKLDDSAQYYFGAPTETAGEKFMGKSMFTEPQADQTSMSANEIHAVHGDFSGYFVRMSPVFFRRSDADPLNPEFSFAVWLDAKVADANSMVSLKMGA